MTPEMQATYDAVAKFAGDVLLFALLALAGYLTPIVKKFIDAKVAEIKSKLGPAEQQLLDYITPIAVDAVEGQALTGVVGKGKAKQDAACKFITDYLASRGVNLDVGTIVARVEAEVVRSYNAPKVIKPQ